MAQLLPETEATEFEGRYYVNPQTAVDETNAFIDNYRNLQQTNTAQIAADTHDLGTDVPSNIGGLSGSGSYWANRYQTPQTASAVEDLRATAQAAALNTALENEKNVWTKRYNDAYRNYQKRQNDKTNTPTTQDPIDGEDPETTDTEQKTGYTLEQDTTETTYPVDVYDSTKVGFDNRSHEEQKNIRVQKDKNGNVTSVTVNGVPHYGREARARYRDLQRQGLVR